MMVGTPLPRLPESDFRTIQTRTCSLCVQCTPLRVGRGRKNSARNEPSYDPPILKDAGFGRPGALEDEYVVMNGEPYD
jgi:hypothetical protein